MHALTSARQQRAGRCRRVPAASGSRPEDRGADLGRARRHHARRAEDGRPGRAPARALRSGRQQRGEDPAALAAGAGRKKRGEDRGLLGASRSPRCARVVEELAAHPAAIARLRGRQRAPPARDRSRPRPDRDLDRCPRADRRLLRRRRGSRKSSPAATRRRPSSGHQGLRFDLRVVPPECFGNVLQHFTGSKDHNVALREDAQRRGLSISEYGVTIVETDEVVTHATEDELYDFLGYQLVPPELREDSGELAAARERELPDLVELADLRGELHCHSTWSADGKGSIEEMAVAAKARGYRYLCLTDHSHYLRDGRLEAQWKEIEAVNARVAAVPRAARDRGQHPRRRDDRRRRRRARRARLGRRIAPHGVRPRARPSAILAAIDNPHVDCIGHLTGRRMLKRDGADGRRRADRRRARPRPAPRSRSTRSRIGSTCATRMRGWPARRAS